MTHIFKITTFGQQSTSSFRWHCTWQLA